MDAISEVRLAEVHPELARRVHQLARRLEVNGIVIRVTQGFRSWAQQAALYSQGRLRPGPIVTNAQPGHSAHEYGYAVDIVPDTPGFTAFTPDWNAMDVRWKQVLTMAKYSGLAEGAQWRTFPDTPHLYLEELPADPDAEMRYLFKEGGCAAVWSEWKMKLPILATPTEGIDA